MSPEKALEALRRADADRAAPPRVEAAVLDAFRRRPKRTARWVWPVAIAAALLVSLTLYMTAPRQRPEPAHARTAPSRPAALWGGPLGRGGLSGRPSSVRTAARRRNPQRSRRSAEIGSLASQFIPVPYAPPLPSDEIQIVRVRVQPEAFGLWPPISEAREADVVAGADGIVRAVRWIR